MHFNTKLGDSLSTLTFRNGKIMCSGSINVMHEGGASVKFEVSLFPGELYMDLRQTRCPLLLVADYRFFSEMGGGSSKTTVNYLISLIDR